MSAGSLDDCIKAMTASFTEARQHHPAILFIDEIDSAGNRENFSGQNATWNTAFLNALLTQFDAMDSEEVVVIAATNYADNVDPALRRAGRLDRLIRIPRPGIEALMTLYRATLSFFGSAFRPEELRSIADASLGLTGADVIVMVRGAHRRARHDGDRAIMVDDVLNEIFRIPPTAERHPVNPQQLRATAIHEAGHAIVALALPSLRERVNMISVMPDEAAGTGGFVSIGGAEVEQTRIMLRDRICVALAARVAETMMLGEDDTTLGAGGTAADCDLARAARMALQMTGVYGFSSEAPDWWSKDGNVAEAQEIIAAERIRARKILTDHGAWYQKLVEALVQSHRLSRLEILALREVAV
jgi:ATP-dependent Zn protease